MGLYFSSQCVSSMCVCVYVHSGATNCPIGEGWRSCCFRCTLCCCCCWCCPTNGPDILYCSVSNQSSPSIGQFNLLPLLLLLLLVLLLLPIFGYTFFLLSSTSFCNRHARLDQMSSVDIKRFHQCLNEPHSLTIANNVDQSCILGQSMSISFLLFSHSHSRLDETAMMLMMHL